MAVPSKISILGIFDRFEKSFDIGVTPRWVDIPYHDIAYSQYPINAQSFEETLPLSKVSVFRRTGKVIYENLRKNGKWTMAPNVEFAIEKERSKHMSQIQKNAQVNYWTEIVQRYENRFSNDSLEFQQRIADAKDFLSEATLFAQSIFPRPTDSFDPSKVLALTHHHVFIENKEGKLIAYNRDAPQFTSPTKTRSLHIPKDLQL